MAFEPFQNLGAYFGLRRGRIGLDELETVGDSREPSLDCGIAGAEHLLHLLDRSMTANEGRNEDLVLEAQPGQLRQLETALDGDVFLDESNPLDDDRLAFGELGQFLPIFRGSGFWFHNLAINKLNLLLLVYILNNLSLSILLINIFDIAY